MRVSEKISNAFGVIRGKPPHRIRRELKRYGFLGAFWFTLVELIVVITILAILATVGFLSLSGYSDDARTATVKANVRTVYSAILTESTTSGNSPRYYVSHDPLAALSWAFAFAEGNSIALSGGQFGEPGTNYSAGNPRWERLRMNGDKFKLAGNSTAGIPYAFDRVGAFGLETRASYSTGELAVGAVDVFKVGANGHKRNIPIFQVAGVVSGSKTAVINGNYVPGTAAGTPSLLRDPDSQNSFLPLAEQRISATIAGNDTAGRKWSDGTIATSCFGYASPPPGKAYAGSVGNGAYWIDPDGTGGNPEFKALCDMTTDGGGWTVFQERFDGSVDFYLGWSSYVAGFGNPGSGEHWLGLERIRTLTATPRSLYVAMARNTGETAYAKYSSFSIGDASTNYALTASGYSGTAWDSLLYWGRNVLPFSTFDADHDAWGNNCAVTFHGAWWYSDCHESNLNGKYYGGAHASFADGMDWRGWLGYYESVTKSRMMVR